MASHPGRIILAEPASVCCPQTPAIADAILPLRSQRVSVTAAKVKRQLRLFAPGSHVACITLSIRRTGNRF
jgi:hypothetical protein